MKKIIKNLTTIILLKIFPNHLVGLSFTRVVTTFIVFWGVILSLLLWSATFVFPNITFSWIFVSVITIVLSIFSLVWNYN